MVVRESAPRITPFEKVMAMLCKEHSDWVWRRGVETGTEAYIEVPKLMKKKNLAWMIEALVVVNLT